MNFLKKIINNLFTRNSHVPVIEIPKEFAKPYVEISTKKYIEHPQGDFYAVDGECITCGAPEAEAPDLIAHSKDDDGHCYFKRQPETEEEINRAINAIAVSCISALRYRGFDENIMRRLYEIGEQGQCDYFSIFNNKDGIRNTVEFYYNVTIKDLQNILKSRILTKDYYKIFDFNTNKVDFFQFTLRWTEGLTGTIYKCNFQPNGKIKIEMSKEKDGYFGSIKSNSDDLNKILSNEENISEIYWFNTKKQTEEE